MEKRPVFENIVSFEEFNLYYWYREELSQICKSLRLEHRGTKQDLNIIIEAYFKGHRIEKQPRSTGRKKAENITLSTSLLDCGFSFNSKFREYFSELTGIKPFKFNADMATAWRKVKSEKDRAFTISDLLDVYQGKTNYAKYDNSTCQWNQFLKDFCSDGISDNYTHKLKVASILWKIVRDSTDKKEYTRQLLSANSDKIEQYKKDSQV